MTHYFTPEEANRALLHVHEIMLRIVELKKMIDATAGKARNDHVDRLGIQVSKLEKIGVEIKDIETGLVDFPAMRFGEAVNLCWKLGEKQVLYWHRSTEGFGGRKLLNPEQLEAR
ncbi:MAG: DUF2203 domain-containing protein [Nitrososphaerales archaeon]